MFMNDYDENQMDLSPKVLLWNYSMEEMLRIDHFFQEISAPPACVIEKNQGHLLVHEILFTQNTAQHDFVCDEKVMLFFNVPAETIHAVMRESKSRNLPGPIYAVVTKQSIEWKFSDLVEHLVKERDHMNSRKKKEKN
jgi:hypothetical protein